MNQEILLKPLRFKQVMTMLAKVISVRLPGIGDLRHIDRVRTIAITMNEKLSESLLLGQHKSIDVVAILHDIGKINLPDSILLKPGKLTLSELEVLHDFQKQAVKPFSDFFCENVTNAILSYKENWDGSGYPNKLKGEDIPLMSRIVGISEAFVSLQEERPWKKNAYSKEEALEIIKKESGVKFDPKLVEILTDIASNMDPLWLLTCRI